MTDLQAASTVRLAGRLVDGVPAMLAYFDAGLICRFANVAYARMLGRPPGELLGQPMSAILGAERFARSERQARRALRGHAERFEDADPADGDSPRRLRIYYVPVHDGAEVHGFAVQVDDLSALRTADLAPRDREARPRARPMHDAPGVPIGLVEAREDVPDRQSDDGRLRDSEQFLDRTGRIAGVGGWQVDLRTGDVHWTAHTRLIHEVDDRFEPSLPSGRSFYPPEARAVLDAAMARTLRDGTPWDLELPFITARGRALWVRVFGEVECEGGTPVRMFGAFQDITEYRRHRLALQQEQDRRLDSERHAAELARLLQERGEVLDVLAHEVRQPLNNASAALQSAAAAVGELHERSASVRLTRAQTVLGQVLASIDNTLAVASLLARPGGPGLRDADVDTLMAVSIADMPLAEQARIQVVRECGTRTARMDSSLMRLALRNLLSNALRYSPEGTPVILRVRDWDEPLALVIEVVDGGGGVPAELVPRLFERGARRAPADASQPAGLGLGLYIVRRVMELHAGSAELAANAPGDVTFRLVLAQQNDG